MEYDYPADLGADLGAELAGADLGFSRGGGGRVFFKKCWKIILTFFMSTKLIFRALPEHFDPFGQNFCV